MPDNIEDRVREILREFVKNRHDTNQIKDALSRGLEGVIDMDIAANKLAALLEGEIQKRDGDIIMNNDKCPDCGSDELTPCPLEGYDYICRECGNVFSKALPKQPK